MAVLDAVRGWEYHAGLPHINDVGKEQQDQAEEGSDEPDNSAEEGSDEPDDEGDEVDKDAWTPEQLENNLPRLLETDYETLLLEHEQHVGTANADSIRRFPPFHASRYD